MAITLAKIKQDSRRTVRVRVLPSFFYSSSRRPPLERKYVCMQSNAPPCNDARELSLLIVRCYTFYSCIVHRTTYIVHRWRDERMSCQSLSLLSSAQTQWHLQPIPIPTNNLAELFSCQLTIDNSLTSPLTPSPSSQTFRSPSPHFPLPN